MKPVVVNPSISFEQLVQELIEVKDEAHRDAIREQLAVKCVGKLKTHAEEAATVSRPSPARRPRRP